MKNPELRFKNDIDDWQEKELQYQNLKLCNITTGKLNANAMVENGKYPFFTCDAKPFRIDKFAFDTDAILISKNICFR